MGLLCTVTELFGIHCQINTQRQSEIAFQNASKKSPFPQFRVESGNTGIFGFILKFIIKIWFVLFFTTSCIIPFANTFADNEANRRETMYGNVIHYCREHTRGPKSTLNPCFRA